MASVDVDLKHLKRTHRRQRKQSARRTGVMLGYLERAALSAQNKDKYQNRTGLLRTNTMARVQDGDPNNRVVFLAMLRDYASFVEAHGLTTIAAVSERAKAGILKRFLRDAEKLDA